MILPFLFAQSLIEIARVYYDRLRVSNFLLIVFDLDEVKITISTLSNSFMNVNS